MKYKVSIIMPVFNVEKYIKNALDSVINQTMNFSDIQVIIVNDASTDSSSRILEAYEKFENFHIIHLKNNSGSAAKPRNIALKHVDAEYVMFLDPDDEYSEDYCEIMYSTIKKYDASMVKCNFTDVNDEGIINKRPNFNKNIDKIIINSNDEPLNTVSVCNGIHNYDFIIQNEIYFPEKCFGEDIFFSVEEHLFMDKLIFLNNYFGYIYNNRKVSHAKSPSVDNILNILKVFYLTRELCEKHSREDIIEIVLGTQIMGLYFRIRNVDRWFNKYSILKEVSFFLKTSPKLIVPNKLYRISNSLLERNLIYLTIFYFTLINIFSNSKILQKLIVKLNID